MQPILIVNTGEPSQGIVDAYGSFEDWIVSGLGVGWSDTRVISVFRDEPLPDPGTMAAVIVTGSQTMVTDREPWSERTARWLLRAARSGRPILGICYGHQLLAHALGGVAGDNPAGREIGTITVRRLPASNGDPLFSGLPRELTVHATHVQSVLELPPGALRLAESDGDPNHAFRWGEHAWGVQFHPEFQADVLRAFLEERAAVLRSEGLNPELLSREARDSGDGHALLRRFAELATQLPRASRTTTGTRPSRAAAGS